jgi:hypothetical protein
MHKFSIHAEISKLQPVEKEVVHARLSHLEQKIRAIPHNEGSVLDDSRMAWIYCTTPDLNVDDIAHEIASTNHLYSSTTYPAVVQQRLRELADTVHYMYPNMHWGDIWTIVVKYGVPVVKLAVSADNPHFETLPQMR